MKKANLVRLSGSSRFTSSNLRTCISPGFYKTTHHSIPWSWSRCCRASDIYAFGTVWYELLTGEWPWKEQPPEAIIWQVGEVFRRQHLGKDVVATFDQYIGYISMFWLFSDHSRSLFIYWPFNVKVGKGIRPTLANLQARRVTFSEQWFLHYLFHVIIISISIFMDIIWWYSEYDLFTWSTAG